jgi:hypothetical protein
LTQTDLLLLTEASREHFKLQVLHANNPLRGILVNPEHVLHTIDNLARKEIDSL